MDAHILQRRSAIVALLAWTAAVGACATKPATNTPTAGEAASLEGRWSITRIHGAPPVPKSDPTLTFEREVGGQPGRLNGNAGCNMLMSTYRYSGQPKVLKVEPLASTMMACEPTRMQQESTVARLIEQSVRATQPHADALVLHTADGRTLTLTRRTAP